MREKLLTQVKKTDARDTRPPRPEPPIWTIPRQTAPVANGWRKVAPHALSLGNDGRFSHAGAVLDAVEHETGDVGAPLLLKADGASQRAPVSISRYGRVEAQMLAGTETIPIGTLAYL